MPSIVSNLRIGEQPAPMIAELLALVGLRAIAIGLPWLAHLAAGAGIAGAVAFVVHWIRLPVSVP